MLDQNTSNEWIQTQLNQIPSKHSFRIGEVSKFLDVKPYILRYWESEFSQLRPTKLDNKQRLYYHKDIETLLLIKKLLYMDGYSIKGAKQALKSVSRQVKDIKAGSHLAEQMMFETKQVLEQIDELKKLFV